MSRICRECGRPLDLDHHDAGEDRIVTCRRGRGRLGVQKIRTWGCRLRLVTTVGKRKVPDTPQRQKPELAAFVHESRLR